MGAYFHFGSVGNDHLDFVLCQGKTRNTIVMYYLIKYLGMIQYEA